MVETRARFWFSPLGGGEMGELVAQVEFFLVFPRLRLSRRREIKQGMRHVQAYAALLELQKGGREARPVISRAVAKTLRIRGHRL